MTLATKKKRSQEDTRAKLLAAALDVFAKCGYDAATTRTIARKAGVNESLIHRYFKSKLGLFFALKQRFRENMIQQFLSYGESENIEDEVVLFLKSRLKMTAREKKFFRLSLSRAILDPLVREDVQKYASLIPEALTERFETFRRKGQIRADVELAQVVGVLQSLAFSFVMMLEVIDCLPVEETERRIRTAARLLADGLKPAS